MPLNEADKSLLRDLAKRLGEIAARHAAEGRRARWERHNTLQSGRPLFLVDQLPWNELDDACVRGHGQIQDAYWSRVENWMRRELWKAENLKTDMVVDPYVKLPRPYFNSGRGIASKVTELKLDKTGDVASQHMEAVLCEPEDIEKIKDPVITPDPETESRVTEEADALFGGIIPWRFCGPVMHLGAWDNIAYWMGVENLYIELMDRPEMMHAVMERMVGTYKAEIEQYNHLKIYDTAENYCHCSQTYMPGESPDREGTTFNGWAFGLAQPFTSVSPKVTQEFECEYMKRVFPCFKNIYYGCCDRLDDRMEMVSALPNVRKLSCSPWSHREAFAEKLPKSIIMSNKPNPAFLAVDALDEAAVRADIRRTIDAARRYGKTLEMILKDVSTVRYDVPRLRRFCEIAMEEAGA